MSRLLAKQPNGCLASLGHLVLTSSALLVVLLSADEGRAWDFSLLQRDFVLDVTETVGYTYHFDNDNTELDDDHYHQVLNTLDVSLGHGDHRLGARFDLNIFANTPFDQHCPDSALAWCERERGQRYANHFAAERLFWILARPEYDLTLGDFYASFGKGLALNVVKLDELGQDLTIRGGKLVVHQGDVGFTLLAGQFNPLDVDTATGYRAPWRLEPVIGARFEYNILGRALAGVHGVFINHDDTTTFIFGGLHGDHDAVVGLGLDLPQLFDGTLTLAGEFDLQRSVSAGMVTRGPDREDAGPDGLAGYASASVQLGGLALLGEYKYYDNFYLKAPGDDPPYSLVYHQPPTLERITADLKDNTHVSGTHLRIDYNFGAVGPVELLLFANYGYFENWKDDGDKRIHDPYGGLELLWQDGRGRLELSSGVRRTRDREAGQVAYQDVHVDVDLEQALAAHHSIKLAAVLLDRMSASPLEEKHWRELDASLSYKWSPHLSAAFTIERQEDPAVVGEAVNYYGGALRYYFNPGSYVNLRVGENRPGIKCLNGVCRYYPAFSGVEVLGVVRF